jgi:hypothetical protein
MTSEIRHWGICITCLHRASCLGFHNGCKAGRAIWSCNEYEPAATEQSYPVQSDTELSAQEISPVGIVMGLCSNCTNRNHCRLKIREGGVWFCEEFC